MWAVLLLLTVVFVGSVGAKGAPEKIISKGSCGQSAVDPTDKRNTRVRIVGGKSSKPYSIPWIVSLRRGIGTLKRHFCGGTLVRINEKVEESDIIITAAHCNELRWKPSLIQVLAGALDLINNDTDQQVVAATRFINHENFSTQHITNDIAIIKLAKPLKFSKAVQPACLPEPGEILKDEKVKLLVAGWGYTKENENAVAQTLQQVELPVINNEKCSGYYANANQPEEIHEKIELCAGFKEGGKDACQGDSGGPLLYRSPKGFTLEGIVSFGEGCARENLPGVYTRVSAYIDWINEKIAKYSDIARTEEIALGKNVVPDGSIIQNARCPPSNSNSNATNETSPVACGSVSNARKGNNTLPTSSGLQSGVKALKGSRFEQLLADEDTAVDEARPGQNVATPAPIIDETDDVPKGSCGHTFVDPGFVADKIERGRIVGGEEAPPNSLPWVVSLQRGAGKTKYHQCGGALIRVSNKSEESDIIVTAAHCNQEGWGPETWKAVAGAHKASDPTEPDQQTSPVKIYQVHEQFSFDTFYNDVAIMKLKTPLKFTPTVQPVCLPRDGEPLPRNGTVGIVAGWGKSFEAQTEGELRKAKTTLQMLVVPLIDSDSCVQAYKKDDTMVIDPKGDSGGPVVFKERNKGYVLRGIVSFGKGCAKAGFPGIYTMASNYVDWIRKQVDKYSDVAKRDGNAV